MEYAFVNGEIIESQTASLPISDRGLRFGDGLFETIRLHRGVPYLWDYHHERLLEGLKTTGIPMPAWPIKLSCKDVLLRNKAEEAILRIAVTRGSGSEGYLPTGAASSLIIEILPLGPIKKAPRLWLSTYRRFSPVMLPTHVKLAQGMSSTLALMEARQAGHDNALMLSIEGHVSECANANIFWLKDKVIHTPPLTSGCIAGATRRRLMELSPIVETEASFADLQTVESIALSNSRMGLQYAAELASPEGSRPLQDGFQQLSELLEADRARHCDSFFADWH